jgi:hypothetical protein
MRTSWALEHEGDAFLVQGVGVPGAIDQEILELLQAGGGQDFGDAFGILAGQVRDQAEQVMGAVVDTTLSGEDGAEDPDESFEFRAIDITDDQLHGESPWQIIMPWMSPE